MPTGKKAGRGLGEASDDRAPIPTLLFEEVGGNLAPYISFLQPAMSNLSKVVFLIRAICGARP